MLIRRTIALGLLTLLFVGVRAATAADYLPPDKADSPFADYVSSVLNRLNESVLWNAELAEAEEVFRFTWVRSLHRKAVSIRVRLFGHLEGEIHTTISPHDGKNEHYNRKLTRSEVQAFARLVHTDRFWSAPTDIRNWEADLKDGEICITADGSTWTFEGRTAEKYSLITRKNPGNGAGCGTPKENDLKFFYQLGLEFMDLTGLTFSPIY